MCSIYPKMHQNAFWQLHSNPQGSVQRSPNLLAELRVKDKETEGKDRKRRSGRKEERRGERKVDWTGSGMTNPIAKSCVH